jgi:hypothetical protein
MAMSINTANTQTKQQVVRKSSHCSVCGTTLSVKTDAGTTQWRTCHVDDTGIYCDSCHAPRKINKA